jgi:predicted nucleic acid-binding protein
LPGPLRAFLTAPVSVQSSEALVEPALELAVGLERTVYDSLYLALAIAHECRMVTADRPFYDAVSQSAFGPHVHWVADAPV